MNFTIQLAIHWLIQRAETTELATTLLVVPLAYSETLTVTAVLLQTDPPFSILKALLQPVSRYVNRCVELGYSNLSSPLCV